MKRHGVIQDDGLLVQVANAFGVDLFVDCEKAWDQRIMVISCITFLRIALAVLVG